MTRPDDPTELESFESVEHLLERFRPAQAPAALRARVLAAASAAARQWPRHGMGIILWRSAVAAGIVAAVWLNLAGEHMAAQVAGQVGVGPAVWTSQAEEAAELLEGQGAGRRYLAMALRAGPLRPQVAVPPGAPGDESLIPSR